MAQIHKVESSFGVKAPMGEMFDSWTTKLPLMSTRCPDHIRSVGLLQGRWGHEGSVILWDFNIMGKTAIGKGLIEVMDKKNKRIVYKSLEGGPLDHYKSFSWIFQASPKDNVVRWTLEYEKDDDDVPEPTAYLDMIMSVMKDIDTHLTRP